MTVAEDRAIATLGREGLHPQLGSLTTGSGFAFGAGYRSSPVLKRYGTLDVWAAGSLNKYWAVEARAIFPELAKGHLFAEGWATRRDYPKEDFFGLGPDSQRAEPGELCPRSHDVRRPRRRAARPAAPASAARWNTSNRRSDPERTRRRRQSKRCSTIPPHQASPGNPTTCVASSFIEWDRRQPLNARKGGWYRVDFSRYNDRDFDAYSYNRVDLEARQYVPFLGERRVIAGRANMSTSDAEGGPDRPVLPDAVPRRPRDAAGVPRVSFSRPAPSAVAGGIPLRDLVGARRRACSTTRARSRSSDRIST